MTRLQSIEQKRRWSNPEYRKHMSDVHKGKTPTEEQRKKVSLALKGKIPKNFYEMQKKGWTTSKKEQFNSNWKGQEVGYIGLHKWVQKHLGKPTKCEMCGKGGLSGRFIQWANKDHTYRRNLEDWIRLCTPCHRKYDGLCGEKWSKKIKEGWRIKLKK